MSLNYTIINQDTIKIEFNKFHDYVNYSEEIYSNDVQSLLESNDDVQIEKAYKMVNIRTYANFYLHYHVMVQMYNRLIHYLAD